MRWAIAPFAIYWRREAADIAPQRRAPCCSDFVATQHLLLALAQLDDGPTQMALARLGLKPTRLRDNTLAALRLTNSTFLRF